MSDEKKKNEETPVSEERVNEAATPKQTPETVAETAATAKSAETADNAADSPLVTEKRRKPLPRWAKALGWGLCGIMGTVVIGVGTFTLVPSLQHKVLLLGVSAVDGLSIDHIEGHLFSPTFQGIHYQAPGIDVRIKEVHYRLDWRELSARTVKLGAFKVSGVDAQIDTSKMPPSEPSTEPLGRITLPVSVVLQGTDIRDVNVAVDGNRVALKTLHLDAEAHKSLATVNALTLDGLAVTLPEKTAEAKTETDAPADKADNAEKAEKTEQTNKTDKVATAEKASADKAALEKATPQAAEKAAAEKSITTAKSSQPTNKDVPGKTTEANDAVKSLVADLRRTFEKPFLRADMLPTWPLSPIDVNVKQVNLQNITVVMPGMDLPALSQLTLEASLDETALKVPHLGLKLSDSTTLLGSARWEKTDTQLVALHFWAKPAEAVKKFLPTGIEPLDSLSSLSLNLDGALLGDLTASLETAGTYPLSLKAKATPAMVGLPFEVEATAALLSAGPSAPSLKDVTLTAKGRLVADPATKKADDAAKKADDKAAEAESKSPAPTANPNSNSRVAVAAPANSQNTATTTAASTTKSAAEQSVASAATAAKEALAPEEGYEVHLRGTLLPVAIPNVPPLKPMAVAMDAKGTLTHLTLTNTGLQNSDGTAVMEAELDWANKLTGEAGLALVNFNVAALAPAAPVKLGGEARVAFSSSTGDVLHTWEANLTKAQFVGELLDWAKGEEKADAKASGKEKTVAKANEKKANTKVKEAAPKKVRKVQHSDDARRAELTATAKANAQGEWSAKISEFRWGQNTLTLDGDGRVKNGVLVTHAVANLDLARLAAFSPLLSGSLSGEVTIDGRFSDKVIEPVITADLDSHALEVLGADGSLVAAIGDTTIAGTFGKKGAEPLTVTLSRIVLGEETDVDQEPTKIKSAQVRLGGTIASHELGVTVEDGPAPLAITLTGGLNAAKTAWRGSLASAKIDSPIGAWQTANVPLGINLEKGNAEIAAHCWDMTPLDVKGKGKGNQASGTNSVCLAQKAVVGPQGKAVVALKHFDLATLSPLMPQDVGLKGIFTGDATVAWDSNKKGVLPTVKATLTNKGMSATRVTDNGPLSVTFDEVTLAAKTEGQNVSVQATVVPQHNGRFVADVGLSQINTQKNLSGRIQIDKWSIGVLSQLFSTGEVVHGNLDADIKLGGRLGSPQLNGHIALTNADVKNGLVPVPIEPSDIAILFHGQRSTLDGMIRTTEGELAITGSADWSDITAPLAEVRLRTRRDGKDETMGLTIPPYAQLAVGADVTAKASNAGIDVTGEVVIPQGTITVNELPASAVQNSDDLVMLKRDLTPVKPKSAGMPIRSSLKISIGPRVRVNAFNLKARLQGELAMRQGEQGLGLNGSIQLRNGNFFAYGQALNITKGEILFSGPVDNPYLNLEAIRDPNATEDSVTAGLRVTGAASAPKVTIFSTPAMSNEEALSYLLRGQGLGSSSSDGQAVATALLGMGLSQTSNIVGSIGSAFGIRDLQVTSEGVGVKTKVVVKGNLLPRLQVKYGIGVFDSLATFTLRYRLMPRLYLQGVWGENQTLDLLYRWEFN